MSTVFLQLTECIACTGNKAANGFLILPFFTDNDSYAPECRRLKRNDGERFLVPLHDQTGKNTDTEPMGNH